MSGSGCASSLPFRSSSPSGQSKQTPVSCGTRLPSNLYSRPRPQCHRIPLRENGLRPSNLPNHSEDKSGLGRKHPQIGNPDEMGERKCGLPLACRHCLVLGLVSSSLAFRNPNSEIRISLVAGRNFEPGTVGFQSAPISGFIKFQIR